MLPHYDMRLTTARQLSAHGKKVLQLDSNSFYGSSQATLTLPEFKNLSESKSHIFSNINIFTNETSPPSRPRAYNLALAPWLIYPMTKFYGVVDTDKRGQQYSWAAIDAFWTYTPAGMDDEKASGSGDITTTLATAAVKARKWNKKRRTASTASTVSTSDIPKEGEKPAADVKPAQTSTFHRVPCSEEDIAFSPHMDDRSRATMGLFMRDILDDSYSSNPSPLTTHISTSYPLRPSLTSQILTLLLTHHSSKDIPLSLTHSQLKSHAKSLGIITNVKSAAALTLAYGGLGELCQDWARLVAVNGGVNILERGVKSIEKKGEDMEFELSSGEKIKTSWVVGSRWMFPGEGKLEGKTLRRGIYVVKNSLPRLFQHKESSDDSIPASSVLYFPVNSLAGNAEPVYAIARDDGTADCPRGESVLYISSFSGKETLKLALEKVLEEWADAGTSRDLVWSVEFEQVVGTESTEEGNIIKIGELDADLVVREEVLERLQAWKAKIIPEDESTVTGEQDTKEPEDSSS